MGLVDVVSTIHQGAERFGRMAELVDATALGAVGATHGGSNPLSPMSLSGSQRDGKIFRGF